MVTLSFNEVEEAIDGGDDRSLVAHQGEALHSVPFLFSALGHAVQSLMAIVVSKQVEGLHKASGLELHKPQGAQAGGL